MLILKAWIIISANVCTSIARKYCGIGYIAFFHGFKLAELYCKRYIRVFIIQQGIEFVKTFAQFNIQQK